MILVEIVKLIINIHWALDFMVNGLKVYGAVLVGLNFRKASVNVIVPLFELHDLVAHNLQNDSDGQKYHTEYTEGEHGAHSCWHRSPSG